MNLDSLGATVPQRQAIETLDRPLLLCAGAGSGKTFTLQQRIAYALSPESGPAVTGVDRILAITYTHKAAGEIKSRVRSVLRENAMADEALKVDDAWISTIHGMALRILREHGLELGLPPQLTQLAEDEALRLRQQAFDGLLTESREQPDSPLSRLVRALGATGKASDARALTFKLMDEAASLTAGLDAFDFGPSPQPPLAIARHMVVALEEFLQEGGSANQVAVAEEALRQVEGLLARTGEVGLGDVAALLAAMKLPTASGKAKEAVKALKYTAAASLLECVLGQNAPVADDLIAVARQVDGAYGALKRDRGVVDMADILRMAYRAISDHPLLRQQLQQQFQLIMVDEFQDTNQLQIDLIGLLCRPGLVNLCTVGDSQQSIYRFQGADVNVYLKHKRTMAAEAGARLLQLDDNFRSHGDVLAFVRRVCGVPGFFSEDFLDLRAGRDEEKAAKKGGFRAAGPRISVAVTSYGSKSGGATACTAYAKQLEARHIAQWFGQLRAAGHSAGDMVLLLGSTTHLDTYAEALRHEGFSCHMEGGSGFFDTAESQLIASLLRALVSPLNTQDLFEALSGPMFELSADDFLALSTAEEGEGDQVLQVHRRSIGWPFVPGGLRPAEAEAEETVASVQLPAAGPAVQRAREIWGRAQATARRFGPAEALRQLAQDSGYFARLAQEGVAGQARAANYLKGITLVEGLQQQPGCGMAQAAERYASLAGGKEKLGSLRGDAGQSVRIMTAHGSKGLEFPFVAVADCYAVRPEAGALLYTVQDGQAPASMLVSSGDKEFDKAVKNAVDVLKKAENGGDVLPLAEHRLRIFEEAQREGLLEKRRLFYVAATRASEAMLVSLCVGNTKDGLAPKGVMVDVLEALFGAEIPREGAQVPFGGSQPLDYVFIDADYQLSQEEAGEVDARESRGGKLLAYPPLRPLAAPPALATFAREAALVSYSSLADADEPLRQQALSVLEAFVEEIGDIPGDEASCWEAQPNDTAEEGLLAARGSDETAVAQEAEVADRDKATDFGGALHRLCQIDALAGEQVARQRFDAMVTAYRLTQEGRLREAFERWLGSDVRSFARSWPWVQPELSFQAQLGDVTLHGEIDLFCADSSAAKDDGARAFVVDYKTGGLPQETAGQLYQKHRLQALCYAYAVLRQGFDEVELAFVRVEQDDAENPGQPQVVRYRFRRRAI